MYPNIITAHKKTLDRSGNSCTTERSFSKLKITKVTCNLTFAKGDRCHIQFPLTEDEVATSINSDDLNKRICRKVSWKIGSTTMAHESSITDFIA